MIIGVPRESYPGERRVALVPAVIASLAKAGLQVVMEAGAGSAAGYPDGQYLEKGAKIVASRAEVFAEAEIIAQVLCDDLVLVVRGGGRPTIHGQPPAVFRGH